jgi:hypothetical protein
LGDAAAGPLGSTRIQPLIGGAYTDSTIFCGGSNKEDLFMSSLFTLPTVHLIHHGSISNMLQVKTFINQFHSNHCPYHFYTSEFLSHSTL